VVAIATAGVVSVVAAVSAVVMTAGEAPAAATAVDN
jgi:hypothetical protein